MGRGPQRPHLLVVQAPEVLDYAGRGRSSFKTPEIHDQAAHAERLTQGFAEALRAARKRRAETGIEIEGTQAGTYLELASSPDFALKLESLEQLANNPARRIELRSVRMDPVDHRQHATVFVPDTASDIYEKKFGDYASEKTKRGKPKHQQLAESIDTLRLAQLCSLWTDPGEFPEADQEVAWEVWLRHMEGREVQHLAEFCDRAGLRIAPRTLGFDELTIALVTATPAQLAPALDSLGELAELRAAARHRQFFDTMPAFEQVEWVENLKQRIQPPGEAAPAVCVLDHGVNRQHPLLRGLLAENDCHTLDPSWGTAGSHRHGTEMAGLTAFGDLTRAIESQDIVRPIHRLESVKILPPPPAQNDPHLFGALTAQAVSLPEIEAPDRPRVFNMATTTVPCPDGTPSSWSAAIDALAAGRSIDAADDRLVYLDEEQPAPRLLVISTGNVLEWSENPRLQSLETSVEDPAQAWNALVVGASTSLDGAPTGEFDGFRPLAEAGDLSPHSSTSTGFDKRWPHRPDVVFEGGNVGTNGADYAEDIPELTLLTTHWLPARRSLTLSWGTSAATAQVSRLAARVHAAREGLWPETVRGLVVHSARWSSRMRSHLPKGAGKNQRGDLLKVHGHGIPDETRAVHSATNEVTLLAQEKIRPFQSGKLREMHLHDLPWPEIDLFALGKTHVTIRVTLSYFIEPNPGSRGWARRHRYASHGLRFALKRPGETPDAFLARINKLASTPEPEEEGTTTKTDDNWFFGPTARDRGSLHADHCELTAEEAAERSTLAVYPVSGWWMENKSRDRSEHGARYALIVSIETEDEGVDLWAPVAMQVGVPVEDVKINID